MSNWGGQPQAGHVTFYDPTKFQVNAQPAHPQQPQSSQQATHNQQPQNIQQATAENHWSSWGAWDPGANPYASEFSGSQTVSKEATVNSALQTVNQQPQESQQNPAVENQQQWYGNWNQEQQYNNAQHQWDQNQYHIDPNTGQWVPNQFNYWETGGYTNNWSGQNGVYTEGQNGYGSENQSVQAAPSQGPSIQYPTAQQGVPNAVPSGKDSLNDTVQSNDLDISQSTESGSADQSLGNVEDGGGLAGFYNNDDYEDDSDESDNDEEDDEPESNINVNSSAGIGASNFENENEQNTQSSVSINHIQSQGSSGGVANDLNNQMQALHLQENVANQGSANYGYNYDSSNVPTYAYQSNLSAPPPGTAQSEPEVYAQAAFQAPPTGNTVPWPPTSQATSDDNLGDNTDGQGIVTATPTFSDWEMVPPPASKSTHSRNASSDNNVQFFIGSTSSSARVSPATSGKGVEEKVESQSETACKTVDLGSSEKTEDQLSTNNVLADVPGEPDLPPMISLREPPHPPPMASGPGKGANPFRKSPNTRPLPASSGNDSSMLSSTQLDITRPNYENSPVTLGPSISPIMPDNQNRPNEASESPVLEDDKVAEITDTPVSKQPRKTGVKQSPILPRKESPFQPPKQDQKMKPLKASHDIPGVEAKDQRASHDRPGLVERKGRRTPETDRGRRTPDRDAQNERQNKAGNNYDDSVRDRRTEGRDDRGYDRGYGRRTPDWDSSDRRAGRRTPDKESRYRGDRDRGYADRPSRQRQSAFHYVNTNRSKDNVSPAASLLDIADSAPVVSNILLVPASNTTSGGKNVSQSTSSNAPLELNPVVSLISSLSEHIKSDDVDDDNKTGGQQNDDKDRDLRDRYRDRDTRDSADRSRYRERDRGDLRGNKSSDSLKDRNLKEPRNDSRERLSMYSSRNSLEYEDSRDRGRRGDSRERDRRYRDDYYDKYRYL